MHALEDCFCRLFGLVAGLEYRSHDEPEPELLFVAPVGVSDLGALARLLDATDWGMAGCPGWPGRESDRPRSTGDAVEWAFRLEPSVGVGYKGRAVFEPDHVDPATLYVIITTRPLEAAQ